MSSHRAPSPMGGNGPRHTHVSISGRCLATRVAGVILMIMGTLIVIAAPASAAVGFTVTPIFPPVVSVGDGLDPEGSPPLAILQITNSSTTPDNAGSVTLNLISVVPSCGTPTSIKGSCPGGSADIGVFNLAVPADGEAGTACAGTRFGLLSGGGKFQFVPDIPVTLGPAGSATDTCRIDFYFAVQRAPADADLATRGLQTYQLGYASGTNNASGAVGDGSGSSVVTVNKASPTISTTALGSALAGTAEAADTATLSGGASPTGSITFAAFGPDDPTCTGIPVNFGTHPVLNGAAQSDSTFLPPLPGTYRFVAAYSGDPNNNPVSGACGAAGESVVLTPSFTAVKTASRPSLPEPGGTFTFSIALSNASGNALTVTSLVDDVYGDLNGKGICVTGEVLAAFGGTYSCSFPGFFTGVGGQTQTDTVTATAVYAGGTAVSTTADATVTISGGAPAVTIATMASPSVPVGGTVRDTATLVGGTNLTGTITFNLFGPNDSTCTGTPVFTSSVTVAGAGNYDSPPFTTAAAGTYRWTASYSGNANNASVSTTCNDPAESVNVTTAVGSVQVVKTASPLTLPAPGGTFTFTVAVTNTGPVPERITSVVDNIYGDAAARPGSTCGALIGTTLAPGALSAPCTFTGDFTGPAGASQTDVVTVRATDAQGTVVTATDDATVSIINVVPAISVDKTATPATLPAPGGTFTFTVAATNTGPSSLTITSLTDNIYGDVGTKGTCTTATGTVLASGASHVCSFTGPFTGAAGATQTDTVTVTATDAQGTVVTATDDATVTLTAVGPPVSLATTATPGSAVVGGAIHDIATLTGGTNPTGTITFNLFGPNDAMCTGTVTFTSTVAVAGGPVSSADFIPTAAGTYRWTATYSGDANNASAVTTCNDPAELVTVAAVTPPPSIGVAGSAVDHSSLPEPGGTFTGSVAVTNTGTEAVTLTALADEDLDGVGTCDVPQLLAPGATYRCTFPIVFTGNAGDTITIPVTATAVDSLGRQVVVTDTFVLSLTDVVPTLTVTKTADPATMVEPGGSATYTVTATNTSNEAVTVTGVVDDVYGDLTGQGCPAGKVFDAGGTYTCSFTAPFTGVAGDRQTDTVTVTVTDDDHSTASASASATVVLTSRATPPAIAPLPPVLVGTQRGPVLVTPVPVAPVGVGTLVRTGVDIGSPLALAFVAVAGGLLMVMGARRRRHPGWPH